MNCFVHGLACQHPAIGGHRTCPRPIKCSGVFNGVVEDSFDPLATGLPALVPVPHSRLNDTPVGAPRCGPPHLVGSGSSGCRLVSGGATAWRLVARPVPGPSGVRDAESLSRVSSRRAPVVVRSGCSPVSSPARRLSFSGGSREIDRFRISAQAPWADPREQWARFPYDDLAPTVENTWADGSALLYRNWLRLAGAALPLAA